MGLNHPIPLSFHIRTGQLDHSWVSRFYNTQLAPGKLTIAFKLGGGNWRIPYTQSKDSLLDPCVILAPRQVSFVLIICALAQETLYPLSSLEPELYVSAHFSHVESRLVDHLHIVIFSH